jgi:hypothetical protein
MERKIFCQRRGMNSRKFIPFVKEKKLELVSKGSLDSSDGEIIDQGTLGKLKYEIYKRGTIKITSDDNTLVFKKDINIFENEVRGLNFDSMLNTPSSVNPQIIKGSGDNDHLVFSKVNGDIEISLKKREFSSIETLHNIIAKGKKKLSS